MGPFRHKRITEPIFLAMRRAELARTVKEMSEDHVTGEFADIMLASYRNDVPAQKRLGELFRQFPDEEG